MMLMIFAVMSWICCLITGGCFVYWKQVKNSNGVIAFWTSAIMTLVIAVIYLVALSRYGH
ncbi:hypothetical protein [Nissabacter sp. SGAir0207]|uniref:hypothetical protein n=1 Tax=Nissabacter sp. SGAir0207 TaxID=2126321 RepID=UPI0010CCE605|nr:hypothetical protein [Nissabacter sp. SGAir0207]QCR34990.1 hypothetical protein C1N62_02270 [Nissabacter sp. SGAir0207]